MVSNPRLIPFSIASTTGELADASQIVVDNTNLSGLLSGAGSVQRGLERIDHTGLGAPIFSFVGNFAAASANIAEWFNNQATRSLQGAAGQANALRTFDLPGTSALNTVFDALVADGLPETYTLTISYLGGLSGASVTVNRLLIRPRASPSPQIDGRASVTLSNGDSVTLQITRSSGTIGNYVVVSEGRLPGTAGTDTLGDIELRTQTWDATDGATLPGVGQVQRGWAFEVINAPTDGSGRFNEVLYTGDWVVYDSETFTGSSDWANTNNWFVIAASDVRRLTLAGQVFLQHVGTKSVIVRGNDYADTVGEIRIQLYQNAGDYTAGDLNTNGQIDQYTDTSDLLGYRVAIRFPGTAASLATVIPSLHVYAEDTFGNFTRLLSLSNDFTNQGDFTSETDYLADSDINYRAGDVLRIYVTSTSDFNTIADYQAIDNIDNASITEPKLDSPTRRKLNAQGSGYDLPPALQALNSQARVFNITHTDFRSNNSHLYLNNSFATLKGAPITFPNVAGGVTNEITGSATAIGDPTPLTAAQDVTRISGGVMSGAGIQGAQIPITPIDNNNWRFIIGGWMTYPNALPSSYESIFQVAERGSVGTVYRDVFGVGPSGFVFKQRATVGSTQNVGIVHRLISTTGLLTESYTSGDLEHSWRVYTGGTYSLQVEGYNNGVLQGAQAQTYTITAVNQDQAETTLNFDLGAGSQALRVRYDAQRSLYGGRGHTVTVTADSIIAGLDEIRVYIDSASTVVATSTGNTYNDVTLRDGHAAPDRLMRYIVSFRSVNGTESSNLEAIIAFFGYDLNGNPTLFEENTISLSYPALDLEWDTIRYGSTGTGIHQNVQGFVLNPDTPLIEYPRHATLNGWLSSHDNKANDWCWDNVHEPSADTEAVYFPEFVNFPNLLLESPNRTVYQLTVDDSGALKTEVVP